MGAKTGTWWWNTAVAMNQASAAATAHWPMCHALPRTRSSRVRTDTRPRRQARSMRASMRWSAQTVLMAPILPSARSSVGQPTVRKLSQICRAAGAAVLAPVPACATMTTTAYRGFVTGPNDANQLVACFP